MRAVQRHRESVDIDMTPERVLLSLGYDDMGNNAALLHPDDKRVIEGEDGGSGIPRASHMVVCKCGYEYWMHPKVQGALYFTRTCQGIVKL